MERWLEQLKAFNRSPATDKRSVVERRQIEPVEENILKWPEQLILVRHDVSNYNALQLWKSTNERYLLFKKLFDANPDDPQVAILAALLAEELEPSFGDAETPLMDYPSSRAKETGYQLSQLVELPDVIFVSPYLRTIQTYEGLCDGWPALRRVRMYKDERIREQDHGLAALYRDWRIFHALHPEQRKLYKLLGPYRYPYPQGEDMPRVRERAMLFNNTNTRDWSGKRVWGITHHKFILGYIANMERWDEEQFLHYDHESKPVNCGVTVFNGNPQKGTNGKFELEHYSRRLFKTAIDPALTRFTAMDMFEDETDLRNPYLR